MVQIAVDKSISRLAKKRKVKEQQLFATTLSPICLGTFALVVRKFGPKEKVQMFAA